MRLISLKRYTNEDYTDVESEITKGSKLFLDAEEKIEKLVENQKLPPEIPNYFWEPDDY